MSSAADEARRSWVRQLHDSTLDGVHSVTSQMSLAARVAVLTTLSVAITLALLSTLIYLTARDQFIGSLDRSLFKQAEAAAASGVTATAMQEGDNTLLGVFGIQVGSITSGDGAALITKNSNVPNWSWEEREVALGRREHSARTATIDGVPYRVVAVQWTSGKALILAQSMESTQRALDKLTIVLMTASIAGMLMAGAAGWAVAENGLRPVRRLTEATERVARERDLTPIEASGGSQADDLARLTDSFNGMLRALSESQARERQLIADAGHELRTPLTSLRTNIELLRQVTLASDRTLTPDQRRELMDDVGAQLDELTTLVGDLVELARDEPIDDAPEPVMLADVVRSSLERVRLRAPDIAWDIDLDDTMVFGDVRSLERAVTNLLDNAGKWSPLASTVTVRLKDGSLSIADQGPGISEADLPRVFDRFYRSDDARSLPGSGLGLSIVRRTAELHHGTVTVESVLGHGATFTLTLPTC